MEKRISLVTQDQIHLLLPIDILYCKCNYTSTTFHLVNNDFVVVSKGIKAIEKMLKGDGFIRSHQSYLVNINHIIRLDKADNYKLVLSNNEKLPTAIRRRKEMMKTLKMGI
ncbi:MAG: LytTR family transcriptional regulator DNA-binding domain-containing protein [Bacteroidales bacterium]|nr:LytTR family transcriptional regulator DNA-binding domain-containing protein [Bacteroidales bacterium]